MEMKPVTRPRECGGSSVNRKPIKICVNEENGFKYQDNTCNTCQTAGKHLKSQIVRWASKFYCCAFTPIMAHTYILGAKTRAIYNLPEIWDPKYFVFYPSPDMAPSVFTSIISPCLAGSGCWKLRTDDACRHPISWSWFNSSSQPSHQDQIIMFREDVICIIAIVCK